MNKQKQVEVHVLIKVEVRQWLFLLVVNKYVIKFIRFSNAMSVMIKYKITKHIYRSRAKDIAHNVWKYLQWAN